MADLQFPIIGHSVTGDPLVGQFTSAFTPFWGLGSITALVGGTSSDLDSVSTVNVSVGAFVCLYHAATGAVLAYRLTSGSPAETVPWDILPDDHNASTNAKYWRLLFVFRYGLICVWDKGNTQKFYPCFSEEVDSNVPALKPDINNAFTITG